MKTNVTKTSIRSYVALKASGFVGQHAAVISRMEPGAIYSRRQISKLTGLEISTVAGRVNELIEEGQIIVCGNIKCPFSGRLVEAVKLLDAQMELM